MTQNGSMLMFAAAAGTEEDGWSADGSELTDSVSLDSDCCDPPLLQATSDAMAATSTNASRNASALLDFFMCVLLFLFACTCMHSCACLAYCSTIYCGTANVNDEYV